jgi:hypothetical protein
VRALLDGFTNFSVADGVAVADEHLGYLEADLLTVAY